MKIILYLLIIHLMVGTALAQKKSKEIPPIIDREIFFGNPEIVGAQLSPDGRMMSFIKPYQGVRNIWVKKINEPFEKAKPLTNDQRPISSYFWSRSSKFILYVQDKGGNENYQVFAVIPNEKADPTTGVPVSRNLTNKENTRAQIVLLPKSNPDLIIIALNDRDPSWHDLYELKISTAELKLLNKNTERYSGWIFDQKDKLRLAIRSNDDGSTDLLRIDPKSSSIIYSCTVLEEINPINFNNDGENIYMITNVGAKTDLSKLILFNVNTQKEVLIESDPKKRVDFGNAIFSEIDNSLLMTDYQDDKTRQYWKNKSYAQEYNNLKKQFKGYEISFSNSTKDEKLWLISVYSDTEPSMVYLYDRNSKKTSFQYKPRPLLPTSSLSEMKIISYKSSDGLEIPAYLTLPKNVSEKNLPLIVNPHGGPWARDHWGYNPYAQFLTNRGYAVLQMNFRGSTGYGKKFIDAGNKEWGDKMQDDITYGVKYLVKKGIVDPTRVAIFGGSYGGYASLAGLTFTPDLYACGISMVGPSSLLSLLESLPPYWEAGRKIFYTRMGDPTNPEGQAQLKRQSPLYSVDKIKVPLMVVQGANDPRVKKAESDQIVTAMRDKKLSVEYLCANDEGHGFANPTNNLAFLAAAEKFLTKHLGGRYQESMSPEIEKRLKLITVDLNSLPKNNTESPSKINSNSSHDLSETKYVYKSTTKFLGENFNGAETIEITEKGSNWIVKSVKELPIGTVTDNGKIKKGSLVNYTRDYETAGLLYQIGYSNNLITVRKTENGKKSAFKIKVDEDCFADGPIAQLLIASLPLTDTFKRRVLNLDLENNKVIEKIIEVTGIEMILGQECFKVEYKSVMADNHLTTIWVSISNKPKALKYVVQDDRYSEEPITYILQDK
ncbi:MAG: S9 family peptidase [Saprospiraceae bacterium]